jgi:hypothetical protein
MRTFSARVKSQFGRGKGKKERKERTFGLERTSSRRVDDEATSRQPLSDLRQRQGQSSGSEGEESENGTNVVVRVSFQLDSDARCQERSQRLTRRSTAMDVDGVARKTFLSIPLRDVVGERRPECTVRVDNVDVVDTDGETLSEGELVGGGRNVSSEGKREKTKETHLSLVDELVVETEVELMVLRTDFVATEASLSQFFTRLSKLKGKKGTHVAAPGRIVKAGLRRALRSIAAVLGLRRVSSTRRRSLLPTISLIVLNPSLAMIERSSSAT